MTGVRTDQFASEEKFARRGMAWYAAMFETGPVLDFGAGRGYFVEALRANGVQCVGVDSDEGAVAKARLLGIDVALDDGFTFLGTQSDLGGMFVSHVIEHLTPVQVGELFGAAHRALRPGGTLVVVTPNPRDWLVISEIFWLDPTHVRPYPMQLVSAMLESAGFSVESVGLRPTALGLKRIPTYLLNRIRFGAEYGRGEAWVRARRP